MENNPTPKKAKATKKEMHERDNYVLSMMRQGYSDTTIYEELLKKGLKERTAERAVQSGKDIIAGLTQVSSNEQKGKLLLRLDYLFNQSTMGEHVNHGLALKIVQAQASLLPKVIFQSNAKGGTQDAAQSNAQSDVVAPRLAELFNHYQRQAHGHGSQNEPGNA